MEGVARCINKTTRVLLKVLGKTFVMVHLCRLSDLTRFHAQNHLMRCRELCAPV